MRREIRDRDARCAQGRPRKVAVAAAIVGSQPVVREFNFAVAVAVAVGGQAASHPGPFQASWLNSIQCCELRAIRKAALHCMLVLNCK